MKKTFFKILIILVLVITGISFTNYNQAFANRKIDYDSVIVDTENDYSKTVNTQPQTKTVKLSTDIKDKSEKLYAIVDKSQLLKFDEPITRVSITDPKYADLVLLSPKEILLNGKKAGRTSLIFWGKNNKPVFYNLVVQQDADAMIQAIEDITPNEHINLTFTDDGVIMSGHISSTNIKEKIKNIAQAYNFKLIDMSESPTKQVLLEVKITEATRNFTNQLATNFSIGNVSNNHNFATFDGSIKGLQYFFANSSANISLSIQAGEKKGAIKILAEPKLLALDNADASFNVGNEVPVPSGIGQYGQVSYQFKNTGVILKFKPQILEKSNRIILKLSPEVSEVDDSVAIQQTDGTRIPGFKTRKVETTVELADGETLILAGLLKQTSNNTRTQVPWISNIPVLGVLFMNYNDSKDNTELVIFITPKIVDAPTTESL